MNGQTITGAVISVGAWVVFLGTVLTCAVRGAIQDRRDERTLERLLTLRDQADRDWENDEIALWRVGVDPCPLIEETDELESLLLLPDATPGAW